MKLRIVFFGTDEFSAPTLRELLAMNRENLIKLVAVVTKPNSENHGKISRPIVAEIVDEFNAKQQNSDDENFAKIAIFQPTKLREIEPEISALKPDAGVLVSFGKIVPQSTIDIFANGIINFHPSLLPKLRGPSPIETAILNGDRETGLTLMRLTREMDAGPILYQEKVALTGRETASDLRAKFSQRGAQLFREKLIDIVQKNPAGTAQIESDATFSHMIAKNDAILEPAQMSAIEADRRVRAFNVWPKARLNFAKTHARFLAPFPDREIILTETKPLKMAPGDAWPDVIEFADQTALKIDKIVSSKSGKEMTMSAYLRGLK